MPAEEGEVEVPPATDNSKSGLCSTKHNCVKQTPLTQRIALVQRSSAALARVPCVGGFGKSMPGSRAPFQSPVDGAGDRPNFALRASRYSGLRFFSLGLSVLIKSLTRI